MGVTRTGSDATRRGSARLRRAAAGLACLLGCTAVGACAQPASATPNDRLEIVTTTGILADITRNIAGDDARVTALVPPGADPHTYEPALSDVRRIAYADIAFTNHLLLEEQALIRTISANMRPGLAPTPVAEGTPKYGAGLINLVEDASLDTIWLGMRVRDEGSGDRHSGEEVRITASALTGPGVLAAYLTGTFGQPQTYFNSANGFDQTDRVALPRNAHTHVSWAFTQPGVYRLTVGAEVAPRPGADPNYALPPATLTFAVGVDPATALPGATVLDHGHIDLSANLGEGRLELFGDRIDGGKGNTAYDPDRTVIAVPNTALNAVPSAPAYRFLGRPGEEVYVLAQAVLGKHVHGEIDPHLWQSVPNGIAMAEVIRDTLVTADPARADRFRARAQAYIEQLRQLDAYIHTTLETIPQARRNLVTTHAAYGYLGAEYGLKIAGFVTPNPGIEPSSRDLIALTRTLRNLSVPAVFIEPNLVGHVNELRQVAGANGVRICTIYGDSFAGDVATYIDLMATNAYNIAVCLRPEAAPPPRFEGSRPPPNRPRFSKYLA